MMRFDAALDELRAGSIDFTTFVRETRPRWRYLAEDIVRHWRVPAWVGLEDIEQELHLAAWRFVWKFDETRGTKLARYVIYNAYDKAKKKVHKARGASLSGSADRNPGNIDVPFAKWGDDVDAFVDLMMNVPAHQDEYVARLETTERLKAQCVTTRERLVVEVLASTDSIIDGAMILYGNAATRLACEFSSERHACKVVERTVKLIAQRQQVAA